MRRDTERYQTATTRCVRGSGITGLHRCQPCIEASTDHHEVRFVRSIFTLRCNWIKYYHKLRANRASLPTRHSSLQRTAPLPIQLCVDRHFSIYYPLALSMIGFSKRGLYVICGYFCGDCLEMDEFLKFIFFFFEINEFLRVDEMDLRKSVEKIWRMSK